MDSFQILNKDNTPIIINKLDEEVCALWKVPVDKKSYAVEYPREHFSDDRSGAFEYASQSNWFDTIGWMAAEGKSLQDMIDYYTDIMKDYIGKIDEDGTIITVESIYPKRMLLLNTWIEKGYQTKQLKN